MCAVSKITISIHFSFSHNETIFARLMQKMRVARSLQIKSKSVSWNNVKYNI